MQVTHAGVYLRHNIVCCMHDILQVDDQWQLSRDITDHYSESETIPLSFHLGY